MIRDVVRVKVGVRVGGVVRVRAGVTRLVFGIMLEFV